MIQLKCLAYAVLVGSLAVSGCMRQDRRTEAFAVPQMAGPECFRPIQEALKNVEGVEQVSPDYAARTVAVTYNALKLGIKNVEFIIAGAGFDANTTPGSAEARAKLPAGCAEAVESPGP